MAFDLAQEIPPQPYTRHKTPREKKKPNLVFTPKLSAQVVVS